MSTAKGIISIYPNPVKNILDIKITSAVKDKHNNIL
jgi:hypothetical protein